MLRRDELGDREGVGRTTQWSGEEDPPVREVEFTLVNRGCQIGEARQQHPTTLWRRNAGPEPVNVSQRRNAACVAATKWSAITFTGNAQSDRHGEERARRVSLEGGWDQPSKPVNECVRLCQPSTALRPR